MEENFLKDSENFFNYRASLVSRKPSREELCFISGRDPRIWCDDKKYLDLINDLRNSLKLNSQTNLLEVGCAGGFLANGLAPWVGKYTGVDMADRAIQVARRLKIESAKFIKCNAMNICFDEDTFDAAFCYDTLINYSSFNIPEKMILEMLRVVKPGGKVLIGSIPDKSQEVSFANKILEIQEKLTAQYGEIRTFKPNFWHKIKFWRRLSMGKVTCYYHEQKQFIELGERFKIPVEIVDVHSENPYKQHRFSVIYNKPL